MEEAEALSAVIRDFVLKKIGAKGGERVNQSVADWLDKRSMLAKQTQFVTHPAKYTHSDAKGSSVCDLQDSSYPNGLSQDSVLIASTVRGMVFDFAGNAAVLDVAALLELRAGNVYLYDCIRAGDVSPLRPLASSDEQAKKWLEGLRQAFSDREPESHVLAKQVYFPLGDGQYHLLSPLFASTLSCVLGDRIRHSRYSDEAKEAREAKRNSKASGLSVVDFRKLAVQAFGGSKPQNISLLNSRQNGKTFLFSCAAPHWKSQTRPPLNVDTIFSRGCLYRNVSEQIEELRTFLEKSAGTNNKRIRERRAQQIDRIVDLLIAYGAEIQQLKEKGWSASSACKLPQAQKLWLDPHRGYLEGEEIFRLAREAGEWRREVADAFAKWLNAHLSKGELRLGDVERREWRHLVESRIRHFTEYREDEN